MSETQTTNIGTFKNPQGSWSHRGAYVIELASGANRGKVPRDIELDGNTIRVYEGEVSYTIGGFHFKNRAKPFYWTSADMRSIRDGKGRLLWVNGG